MVEAELCVIWEFNITVFVSGIVFREISDVIIRTEIVYLSVSEKGWMYARRMARLKGYWVQI